MKKFIIGITASLASAALIGVAGVTYYVVSGVNAEKDFVSFEINNAEGNINQTSGEIDVVLPTGTSLSSLSPYWTISGRSVTLSNGQAQYSGLSPENFESDVGYVVHASDGSVKDYLIHVTTSSGDFHSYFDIFSIDNGINGGLSTGTITDNNITVTVPSTTNLSSLVAFFKYVGKNVKVSNVKQISNVTTNNFTSPVGYSVTANDGTAESYTVTVTPAAASAKAITSFSVITNNGTYPCQIVSTTITCGIPNTIDLNQLIVQWSSTGSEVDVSSIKQYSGLTVNNFQSPVTYVVKSGDGLTTQSYTVNVSNSQYILLNVENLANTIFDNESYPVSFNVTNNTSSGISSLSTFLSIPAPFVWTLGSNTCDGESLPASSSCLISGTLNVPKSYGQAAVKLLVNNPDGQPIASFDRIITAIPQLNEVESGLGESYAAYTFVNDGSHRLFTTAAVNGNNICFHNNHVGFFTNSTESYGTCAVEMTKGNNTLYIPAYPGAGGKILISVDNKLPDGPVPSVTATTPADAYYTRWQQVEYGGGLDGSSNPALFNLNPTNVDFASLPVSISTVISGVVGIWNDNSFATQGILFGDNIKTQTILLAMESGLDNVPNAGTQSWSNLPQLDASQSSILRILSPGTVWPFMGDSSSQFYFDGSIYNNYIDDLWTYYTESGVPGGGTGKYLYVNDDPVAAIVSPGATCTLRCQVTVSDNLMHCAQFSGSCPTNSNSGTLDGAYTLSGGSSPAGFTKFTPGDFVSAAGASQFTTFGLNETYRSVTGENIVSAQSVGFMPFCSESGYVFGEPEFAESMSLYYQPQYNCLTNYSTYTTAVLDQYSYQSGLYFGYYNYGYSDTLNQSGAVYDLDNESYPFTIEVNYQ